MEAKGISTQPRTQTSAKRFSVEENNKPSFEIKNKEKNPYKAQKQAKPIQKSYTKEELLNSLNQVAEGMETQFAHHMIKQMKSTVPKDTPDSNEVDYYNSLLDYERAKMMASDPKGGLGIKKMVLNQITPDYLKEKVQPRILSHNHNVYKNAVKENSHE